jgi:hypothetical protein
MSDETTAPVGGELDAAPVIAPANLDSDESFSPEQALEAYQKRTNPTAESAEAATAEPELAEANADPETDPSEEPEDAEPAEVEPPIERPRSWTKDEDAEWQSLPRAMQQKIVAREQERDTGLRRSQNEAAEQRKAIEAERTQAEQARKEYEAKLPAIMQALQDVHNSQFADIKTMADVERLAMEDPFRKIQWDTHQQKLQMIAYEQEQANKRQDVERQTNWTKFQTEETAKAVEMHPELADPKKSEALGKAAKDLLVDKGFTDGELAGLAGGEKVSPFDHRMQSIILDAIKYREAQKAPPKAIPKPVPAVQKPGVAASKGAAATESVQALRSKLSGSGSVDDAFALYQAKQRSRAS